MIHFLYPEISSGSMKEEGDFLQLGMILVTQLLNHVQMIKIRIFFYKKPHLGCQDVVLVCEDVPLRLSDGCRIPPVMGLQVDLISTVMPSPRSGLPLIL